MAELLRTFEEKITDAEGKEYTPRVCARERDDQRWEGWLEFVPSDGSPVLRSQRETTQPNRQDADYWASGLTRVYAEGALARTLEPIQPVRDVPRGRPAYEGPAPPRRSGNGHPPVLDPFSVIEAGGRELLHRRLMALADRHVRHIALHYRLVDPRQIDLDAEPRGDLAERIVQAVSDKEAATRRV